MSELKNDLLLRALLRPGGRCVVWDTRPLRGAWRPLNPLFVPEDIEKGRWDEIEARASRCLANIAGA